MIDASYFLKSPLLKVTYACYLFTEFLAKDLRKKLDEVPKQAIDL
jgi:hypothetical protein